MKKLFDLRTDNAFRSALRVVLEELEENSLESQPMDAEEWQASLDILWVRLHMAQPKKRSKA